MLNKEVKEVFVLEEAQLEKQRREFDTRLAGYEWLAEKRAKKLSVETRSVFRRIIFTIVAVNVAVAVYMTVFISYNSLH